MGFMASPIYVLSVVVLAFGGIPKGKSFIPDRTTHIDLLLQATMKEVSVLV
jgi:hypothetical protein